jgi:phosphoheptose isomerase
VAGDLPVERRDGSGSSSAPVAADMMAEPISTELVRSALEESARVKLAMRDQASQVVRVAALLVTGFRAGKRVYACGNGGSACDAIHLVEELVARYKRDRPGLPAHHLLDAPTITCWSNDEEFDSAFERQVRTLVMPGDVLIAISTSGNSENVVRAARAGREREAVVVGLTGRDGGLLREICDELVTVPADATERIQEAHITVIHLLCELVERTLFPSS